tara:strand:- start:577 stop:756 length:180 start_codon:yes stop_codon:yes gene_type:complete
MPGWLNTIIILGLATLGIWLIYDTATLPWEDPGNWDDLKLTLGVGSLGFAYILWRELDE